MKRISLLLMLVLSTAFVFGQTVYTWNQTAGGAWNTPGNWTPTRTTPAQTDILLFNNNTTQTITNLTATESVGRLRIEGTTTNITLAGTTTQTLTVRGVTGGDDLIIANGNSLTLTNSNITLLNTATVVADISGGLNIGTGRTFTATGGNNEVNVSGTGSVLNAGTITTNTNIFAFAANAVYNHAASAGAIPDAIWNTNSNTLVTGYTTGTIPTNLDQNFGAFTWNCVNQTGAAALLITAFGNSTRRINIVSTGSSNLTLLTGNTSRTLTITQYAQTGGSVIMTNMSNTARNLTIELTNFGLSGGTLAAGNAIAGFSFAGTSTATRSGGILTGAVDFTIQANRSLDLGTSMIDGAGDFIMSGGNTLITAHDQGLYSAGALGAVQVTGARTYSSSSNYDFRGLSTGIFTTTGNQVNNLTFNRAGGIVTLGRSFVVNGTLTLTNGIASIPVGLSLNYEGTVGGTPFSNAKHISTEVDRTSGARGTFVAPTTGTVTGRIFPLGNGGYYLPITTNTSAGTTLTMSVFTGLTSNGQPNGTPFAGTSGNLAVNATYSVQRNGGGASVSVTPSWPDLLEGADFRNLMGTQIGVASVTGTTWETPQGTAGNNTSNVVSRVFATTTSGTPVVFAVGYNAIPLPVNFSDVNLFTTETGYRVEWTNLTEEDVLNYTIERSVDGKNFSAVGSVLPKTNLGFRESYTYFDPFTTSGNVYYRVRVNERLGKIIYSKILQSSSVFAKSALAIFPNPVVAKQLQFTLSKIKAGSYTAVIIGSTGQELLRRSLNSAGSTLVSSMELPASIKPGVYTLSIKGANYNESRRFIVR